MNFINLVCNEYKTMQWCFTRPFSPPQAAKSCAHEAWGGGGGGAGKASPYPLTSLPKG